MLGTLTSATTSDSIWPLAGGLFFVHLLLADFSTGPDARKLARLRRAKRRRSSGAGTRNDEVVEEKRWVRNTRCADDSLTSSLSLTSALSASVVLASRLPSTAHVYSLVMLAAGLFAGWPTLAKGVRVGLRCSIADILGSRETILLRAHSLYGVAVDNVPPTGACHVLRPDTDTQWCYASFPRDRLACERRRAVNAVGRMAVEAETGR